MAENQESFPWLINGLCDIGSQVQDREFLVALDELCQPEVQNTEADHLFPLQCLTCIRLLIEIFNAPSILQAISKPESAHSAKIVISHYRSLSIMHPSLMPVPEASNISHADILVCGGICLPFREVPHRNQRIPT